MCTQSNSINKHIGEEKLSGRKPILKSVKEKISMPLVQWLGWLEHHPVHQKVASPVPGQGTYPGCAVGVIPSWVHMIDNRSTSLSLSLSLPLYLSFPSSVPLSLKSINISLRGDKNKISTNAECRGHTDYTTIRRKEHC